jgi:chromosome segregation ATPase
LDLIFQFLLLLTLEKKQTKKEMASQKIRASDLEKMASSMTLNVRTIQTRMVQIKREIQLEKEEIELAEKDIAVTRARMTEIQKYMHDIQQELQQQKNDENEEEKRELAEIFSEEYHELLQEYQDEQILLEQMTTSMELHRGAMLGLYRMLAKLVKELTNLKNKEKLLVIVALHSRLVKFVPLKAQDVFRVGI